MLPAFLGGEQIAREVVLVNPLHDHHAAHGLGIVGPGAHRLAPPGDRGRSYGLGLCLAYVVGVVDDDAIAALAGDGAVHGE
ncbi:hypothetical protein D3C86_2084850 [compost metagenome]